MLAKQVINKAITPLSAQLTVADALGIMQKANVKTLPVINQSTRKLVGQVHFYQLQEAGEDALIKDIKLEEPIKIYGTQHIFEAARLMLQYEMRLLPVVNEEWIFQGVVCKSEVLESLTRMLNITAQGSVITIQLSRQDYTLSEIVHLIELEDARILGIAVESPEADKGKFEVSIKLNLKDISHVAAALRRYDYTILTETGSEALGADIEMRADELIKYLDM